MSYKVEQVLSNTAFGPVIRRMATTAEEKPKPGQFYMLKRKTHGSSLTLARAISIAQWDEGKATFLYQLVGKGTEELASLEEGDELMLLGPLGNGFPMDKLNGRIALVGGGVGIAPMIYTAMELENKAGVSVDVIAGFRDIPYGIEVLEGGKSRVLVATETGQVGTKGFVTAVLDPEAYDVVLCCGPAPMMKAVVALCKEAETPVYVSMENRMACGIGACLVCACHTKSGASLRACKDGPVFPGEEVDFDASN